MKTDKDKKKTHNNLIFEGKNFLSVKIGSVIFCDFFLGFRWIFPLSHLNSTVFFGVQQQSVVLIPKASQIFSTAPETVTASQWICSYSINYSSYASHLRRTIVIKKRYATQLSHSQPAYESRQNLPSNDTKMYLIIAIRINLLFLPWFEYFLKITF